MNRFCPGRKESPYPGSEGAITVNASFGSPPNRAGSPGNNVQEFKDRPGPAVHEQERVWLRADTGNVQIMQVNVVQWHLELQEFI